MRIYFAVFSLILVLIPVEASQDFLISNTDWNGISELVNLTESLGYRVNEPGEKVAVVLLAPNESMDVKAFFERRGRILIADDFGGKINEILSDFGISIAGKELKCSTYCLYGYEYLPKVVKFTDHAISRGVGEVVTNHPSWIARCSSPVAYFEDGRIFAAVVERAGKLIVVSDPSVFINEMLGYGDNRRFYVNIIEFLTDGDRSYSILFQEHAVEFLKAKERQQKNERIGNASKPGEHPQHSLPGKQSTLSHGKDGESEGLSESRSEGFDRYSQPTEQHLPSAVNTFGFDRNDEYPHVICYAYFNPYLASLVRISSLNAISEDYKAYLDAGSYEKLEVAGKVPEGYEVFDGDFYVLLTPQSYVRIPSVAPEQVIVGYSTEPAVELEFYRDSADNYYVLGNHSGIVRLKLRVAAPSFYFSETVPEGYHLRDVPKQLLPEVPENVRKKAGIVAEELGLKGEDRIDVIVNKLAAYFRSFGCGDIPSRDVEPDDYLAIALHKNGACRHRAMAFFVTANSLGVPTRYVSNDCHAFVEVFVPEHGWLRLNLGGCGSGEIRNVEGKVPYSSIMNESTRGYDPVAAIVYSIADGLRKMLGVDTQLERPRGEGKFNMIEFEVKDSSKLQMRVGLKGEFGERSAKGNGMGTGFWLIPLPYVFLALAVISLFTESLVSRMERFFRPAARPISSFSRGVVRAIEMGLYSETARIMAEDLYARLSKPTASGRAPMLRRIISRLSGGVHHLKPETRSAIDTLVELGFTKREAAKIMKRFEDVLFRKKYVKESELLKLYGYYSRIRARMGGEDGKVDKR